MVSNGGLATYSTNVDFSKDMISTMIGFYAVIYVVYWVICLYVRGKYDSAFISK